MKSRSRSPANGGRRRRRSSSVSDRSRSRTPGLARRGAGGGMRDGSTPPPPSKRARRDERSRTPDYRRGGASPSPSRSASPPPAAREDLKGKGKSLAGRLGKSRWAKDEDDDARMDVDERGEPSASQRTELDKRESEAKEKLLRQKVLKSRKPTS
ncbi:hypothetical protein FRB90_006588 [Tulasnella sp. 427]|nr:hypothetical protein FRB90_006588 [Tulasnella sp. 427]